MFIAHLKAETDISLYDRALGKLAADRIRRLVDCRKKSAELLRDLAVAIISSRSRWATTARNFLPTAELGNLMR